MRHSPQPPATRPAHGFFVDRYREFRGTLAAALHDRQTTGELAGTLDPEKLAVLLIALADGLQVQWMLEPGIDMAGHIDHLVSLVNRGEPAAS